MTNQEHGRIVALRREIGSQREVAALLDVSENTIGNYERIPAMMRLWYPLAIEELYRRKVAELGRRREAIKRR